MDENKEMEQEVSESELRQDRLIASRENLVRGLKPFGCFLVLFCFAALLILMFTSGREAIEGYASPRSNEYYAEHLSELVTELEENVLPHLEGVVECRVADDGATVLLRVRSGSYKTTRSAIVQYFEPDLFTFVKVE